jgi:hypothetical protein
MCERVGDAVPDLPGDLYTVSALPGHASILMRPDLAADRRDSIAEGWHRLSIPCGGARDEGGGCVDVVSPETNDREETEEGWRGSQNGEVGPLPLGLDAEMGAGFLEGDLDLPTHDEPSEDIGRFGLGIGA